MEPLVNPNEVVNNIWRIGTGTRGCRYCGEIEIHYASNGKAEWSHPGVTCCKRAVQDQLRWRQQDLQRLRETYKQAQRSVADLEEKASKATGQERTSLQAEANRARAGLPIKADTLRLQVDGDPRNDVVGVKVEIAQLQRQLDMWESNAQH
jgi:hypothetical protein